MSTVFVQCLAGCTVGVDMQMTLLMDTASDVGEKLTYMMIYEI
jgi:hypothetical protein